MDKKLVILKAGRNLENLENNLKNRLINLIFAPTYKKLLIKRYSRISYYKNKPLTLKGASKYFNYLM